MVNAVQFGKVYSAPLASQKPIGSIVGKELEPLVESDEFKKLTPEKQEEAKQSALAQIKDYFTAVQKQILVNRFGIPEAEVGNPQDYITVSTPAVSFDDTTASTNYALTGDDKKAVLELIEARQKKA